MDLVKALFALNEVGGNGNGFARRIAEAHDDPFNLNLRFFDPFGDFDFFFTAEQGEQSPSL